MVGRKDGLMRFHKISPCPKCGGKVKAKWEEQHYLSAGDFRESLYAMSLKRLKRKCEKYAKRERKAIAYVATLKEES